MSSLPYLTRVGPSPQEVPLPRDSIISKEAGGPPTVGGDPDNGPRADSNNGGKTLAYYPFTVFIMVIWLAYIAVMLWLLERVASSPTFPQSWWYRRLPDAMQTGFAQGHAAVTAMHLARLAVSALHNQTTAPRSWAELFWLADRNWQGPFGMSAMLIGRKKLHIWRLSTTFVFFALTCLIALPTPYVIQRGYAAGVVDVPLKGTITTQTFAPEAMSSLSIWTQMSRGEGAWATGQSVLEVYDSSVFVAQGQHRDESADDLVIVGPLLQDMDFPEVRAVQFSGECRHIAVDGAPNFLDSDQPAQTFLDWCKGRMPAAAISNYQRLTAYNVHSTIIWCTDQELNNTMWLNTSSASIANGLIWHNATDGKTIRNGFVECQSSFAAGLVQASGRTRDFSNFTQLPYAEPLNHTLDTWLVHPLLATFYDITETIFDKNDTKEYNTDVVISRVFIILNLLGYKQSYNDETGGIAWQQKPFDEFVTQLTRGMAHMGAVIGSLSQQQSQTEVEEYHTVSGRIRDPPFIWGGVGLLAVWFLLIVYTTARMFRPTFGPALDSYVAGRLLTNEPGLVRSQCCGDLSENEKFKAPFVRVGDTMPPGEPYGNIAAGGHDRKKLWRGRSYGIPEGEQRV